jgi:hypothetical protein
MIPFDLSLAAENDAGGKRGAGLAAECEISGAVTGPAAYVVMVRDWPGGIVLNCVKAVPACVQKVVFKEILGYGSIPVDGA